MNWGQALAILQAHFFKYTSENIGRQIENVGLKYKLGTRNISYKKGAFLNKKNIYAHTLVPEFFLLEPWDGMAADFVGEDFGMGWIVFVVVDWKLPTLDRKALALFSILYSLALSGDREVEK